jgi:hypothetical protein
VRGVCRCVLWCVVVSMRWRLTQAVQVCVVVCCGEHALAADASGANTVTMGRHGPTPETHTHAHVHP